MTFHITFLVLKCNLDEKNYQLLKFLNFSFPFIVAEATSQVYSSVFIMEQQNPPELVALSYTWVKRVVKWVCNHHSTICSAFHD